MNVTVLGIDLAKRVFQLHGVNQEGKLALRKRLSRSEFAEFIANLPSCLIGMEACGSAHYWARKFESFGHTVKLINPAFVKPYVKTHKNDYNDAEAICEAVSRPNMRFVPIKSTAQQDVLSVHRIREQLVKNRTALSNQIRGLLAEYGIVFSKQIRHIRQELPTIVDDVENELSDFARTFFRELYQDFLVLEKRIQSCEAKIEALFQTDKIYQRITQIPGIGMLTATALVASIGNPTMFKNGRSLSAWLGLVPRQASSGDRQILTGITKRGDCYLRKLLVHGARSVIFHAGKKTDRRSQWIMQLKEKKGMNKTAVAVANKNARIVWALMAHEQDYQQAA